MSQHDSTPPVPIAAENLGFNWSILFNEPLQPGPLNPANWWGRVDDTRWNCVTADAVGSQVNLTVVDLNPDPGPDGVTFSPPPNDVLDLTGNPAAAFIDFPFS